MLATLLLVYCLEWMLRYYISNSAARQAVYTKNNNRKYYVISMGGCQIRPRGPCCWGGQTFGCAVTFSGFHSGCRLICCIDWTVMLIGSLLWGICSSLNSGFLATAVEVSKSCHNSTIKLLIQNPPISFQDNTVLSLHCKFLGLNFQRSRRKCEQLFRGMTPTYSNTHDVTTVCLWGSAPTEAYTVLPA